MDRAATKEEDKIKTVKIPVQLELMELDSREPTKAHDSDTGYDLYAYPLDGPDGESGNSIESITVESQQSVNIYTGVAVCTPRGWGYSLRGRSSLNKKGIQTLLGTIDAYYSGKLFALLYNGGKKAYTIKKGDRIAQIVFERVYEEIELIKVKKIVVPHGARGAKGFGSSGR
jgi:dUTP pyrophosphatase